MSDRFSAFRHLSYRRYFTSRFLASLATSMLYVAVGWQVYDETENAAYLGAIGLILFLPTLLLVLPAGMVADRASRRGVMAAATFGELICAALILVMTVSGQFDANVLLLIMVGFGIARAFYQPASSSLAVNIVPQKDFPNAVGWNASSWQAASIVGPALGGLLYGVSAGVAYGASVTAFAIATILILSIPAPTQVRAAAGTSWQSLLGGFRYVWTQKIVLGAISLDLFAMLLAGAVALLPVYARDVLELGPMGLGLLRAAPGVGAVIVVFAISAFPIKDHAGLILFACVGLFGISTVVFGASTIAWVSILALVLIGAFDMISVYVREILLQLWTPDEVRGRVNAVNSIFLGASNELGDARAGFMAAKWGAVFTVVFGGFAAIGVTAAWAAMFPSLRKIRSLDKGPSTVTNDS